jgi:hypothetical protein
MWTAMAFAFIFARSEMLFRFDAQGWPQPKNANLPAADTR